MKHIVVRSFVALWVVHFAALVAMASSEGPAKAWQDPGTGMTFVWVPPGTFTMGSPSDERGRYDDERQHEVTLTRGFYMQATEVTQGQWMSIMGSNPSHFKSCGDDCPAEGISWADAQTFIRKLNRTQGTDRYRLPTEAEWEYAARAGTTALYHFGDDVRWLVEYAWFNQNSDGESHPVRQKEVSPWGLYDMYGNVFEWCQDWYGEYPSGAVTDPAGPPDGTSRITRGGSWGN